MGEEITRKPQNKILKNISNQGLQLTWIDCRTEKNEATNNPQVI